MVGESSDSSLKEGIALDGQLIRSSARRFKGSARFLLTKRYDQICNDRELS